MTVYIVTSGEYSDYGICAVFTSQEQAELYISTMPDLDREEYFVEKYETDKAHFEGKVFYGMSFYVTEDFNYAYTPIRAFISNKPVKEEINDRRVTIPVNRYYCPLEYEEEKKLGKIAQDWIAQYKYRKEVDEK